MRFTILDSATRHGVTEEEIRAVVSYPMLRTRLAPRMPGTVPYLFIGNFDDNEPLLEVIEDLVDPVEWVIFHAMMLRPQLIERTQLGTLLGQRYDDVASQRRRSSRKDA